MKEVIAVSFPRSGQTAFESLMEMYFGKDIFIHADSHAYNGIIPCPVPNVICHKTHDFSLNVPMSLNFNYIVRIRNPIEAIISWYKLNFYVGLWQHDMDNEFFFIDFAKKKAVFWKEFTDKWISSNQNNYFLFKYNDFILNPRKELGRAIEDVFEESVDENKLIKILKHTKIEYKNNIKYFKYYNNTTLKQIEHSLRKRISYLKLPSHF